ncbi:MAG: nickel-dependent lactate racemase [Treponema sp.]|jgi:hypothetical protein|nr:nickel-dependent lactate racemase [Treponema sp.]
MSFIEDILSDIPLPRVVKIRQKFDRPVIADVESLLSSKLGASGFLTKIKPGMRIAITAGSRGVTNLPLALRTLVREIKKAGGQPFIFPAMGSHGGATAEGQRAMVEGMGITEEYTEAPIISSMETIRIGTASNGLPVFVDKNAWAADGVIIVNRIKPHVGFRGRYESGCVKMIAIGLGKQKSAENCHRRGIGKLEENFVAVATEVLKFPKIFFSVALMENPYHETYRVEVIEREKLLEIEPALQAEAKTMTPKFHFNPLDVLILDEIGKNISGSGFDNNIVGRFHTPFATPFIKSGSDTQRITRIIALDLSKETKGNGNGIGILDFTTKRAFDKFDFEQTYPNCLTSTVPVSVKIPMVLNNDKLAIKSAIKTCNIDDFRDVRLVRVKNTLCMDLIEISENLLEEAKGNPLVEILGEPEEITFDQDDNLFTAESNVSPKL